MELLVNYQKDIKFLQYIYTYTKDYMQKIIGRYNFKRINEYLKDIGIVETAQQILIIASHNLKIIYTTNSEISVIIDPNIKLYRTNYTINNLCKLINYGNSEVKGTYIITDLFKYISDNILNIYQYYILQNGNIFI